MNSYQHTLKKVKNYGRRKIGTIYSWELTLQNPDTVLFFANGVFQTILEEKDLSETDLVSTSCPGG